MHTSYLLFNVYRLKILTFSANIVVWCFYFNHLNTTVYKTFEEICSLSVLLKLLHFSLQALFFGRAHLEKRFGCLFILNQGRHVRSALE